MKHPTRWIAPLLLFAAVLVFVQEARAARHIVALFPPEVDSAVANDNVLAPAVQIVENAMKEQLGKRFEVRSAAARVFSSSVEDRRRRGARSLGASYTVTSTLSRIGKGVTLDVTLAPLEDTEKGRTVVVSGILSEISAYSSGYADTFGRMGSEAANRINELFFGPAVVIAQGKDTTPKLSGVIDQSGPIQGEVVSVAMSDLDRDGKWEVAAAYANEIGIYSIEGGDLKEKARITGAGPGLFYVDAKDIDRDGVAEIVAVRFVGRRAVSDIWKFDGTEYLKTYSNIPYLLRVVDLGPEGMTLVGQETDPEKIYEGPVFRVDLMADGIAAPRASGGTLPLPEGTFIFGFIPVRHMKEARYVVLSSRDRLVYIDSDGKKLWEGIDTFSGVEIPLGAVNEKVDFPAVMIAADLNRDGIDEVVVMNTLVSAGTFFENLRLATRTELVCLSQAENSLRLEWRSQQTDSAARDMLSDTSRPGFPRFGLASMDAGKILGGATQWRLLWMK
ncbi:MAG: VCBS repeat-containing protein [Syntrophorhabdaceae bacterium]|nr:VCBS repeat-containing protein [Syntrophorhabdaceae bacterium]